MNKLIDGLDGLKMSSSKPDSTKIQFLDTAEAVRHKISAASADGALGLVRDVLLPVSELWMERERGLTFHNTLEGHGTVTPKPFVTADAPEGAIFTVGGTGASDRLHFSCYSDMVQAYEADRFSIDELKAAASVAMNSLLEPIRKSYHGNVEWQRVDKLAYP